MGETEKGTGLRNSSRRKTRMVREDCGTAEGCGAPRRESLLQEEAS